MSWYRYLGTDFTMNKFIFVRTLPSFALKNSGNWSLKISYLSLNPSFLSSFAQELSTFITSSMLPHETITFWKDQVIDQSKSDSKYNSLRHVNSRVPQGINRGSCCKSQSKFFWKWPRREPELRYFFVAALHSNWINWLVSLIEESGF